MNKLGKLAQALKSIGVNNMDEADPETVQKVIRSLKGESDDAVAKIGSGSNLDALQRAKAAAPAVEAPAYPKNVQQDDLGNVSKEFSMVGGPQSKDFTMPHPEAQVPALRTQTMPSVVETTGRVIPENPFTVGQAKPKGLGEVAESMQGQLDDALNPGMSKLKKGALIAGGLGAGALGLGLMDNTQEAPAAETPVSGGQALAEEKVKELPKTNVGGKAALAPQVTNAPKAKVDEAQVQPTEAPGLDFSGLLRQAQQGQIDNTLVNNMLKAGQTIGSALANSKADYTVANSLQEQAGQGVQNVLQQMKSKKDETELKDDVLLRDANSDVSKAFRATLAKLGIPHTEKTTAWDAKAMGINPQNLLMQDRALEKQMRMLEMKGNKERDAFVTGAQKTLLKPYQQYQKVASAYNSIKDYTSNEPTGPQDVAILYDFVKGLDDTSAVKEGEIELGKSAMSLFEQAGLSVKRLTKGDLLSPEFRQGVMEIMRKKAEAAKSNYEEIAQPFKLHGASRGLTEEDYGKFDYMSAAEAKKALADQQKTLEQNPGSVAGNVAGGLVERKTKDGSGRIALFDPTTKQFVKYKDQ